MLRRCREDFAPLDPTHRRNSTTTINTGMQCTLCWDRGSNFDPFKIGEYTSTFRMAMSTATAPEELFVRARDPGFMCCPVNGRIAEFWALPLTKPTSSREATHKWLNRGTIHSPRNSLTNNPQGRKWTLQVCDDWREDVNNVETKNWLQ